jgi:hypothetical protein
MAWSVVEYEKALGIALGKTLKNVDGLIDLSKKIVRAKVSIAILASLEDDPGFPGGCIDA